MLKYSEYKYEEINVEEVSKELRELIAEFINCKTAKEQIKTVIKINAVQVRVDTAFALVEARFSQNVNDKYYSAQKDIVDENGPKLQVVWDEYNKAIVASPFKKELNKEFGPRLVADAEAALKTFSPEIVEDLVENNKLCSKYAKLVTAAKIKFKGKVENLPSLGKYTSDSDRRIRAAASKAYFKYFSDHLEEFDSIYDQMVHVRDRMAKKLGFKNYVDLGYLKLGRTDYNSEDVKGYRDQVYKSLVPFTKQLFRRQAKRLNIKGMKWYDYNLMFLSGNAKPYGNKDELVEAATNMYNEMSPETSEFFNFMKDSELLDLEARKGKSGGGYTTTFAAYKAPFIFSNFNGTSGDVDVLTHEAGHAFMAYCCRNVKLVNNWWPTLEACEIHSMSMEFFAYPWMEGFFKEQTEKYKFAHLTGAITFIPYGVAVDEFQTYVYENPDITPVERRAKWREIEKKYLPHIKYGNNEFLNSGGRFMRQAHIYESPFYYIDYTIAQVCAFEFFNAMRADYKEAWGRYISLCKLGGSETFLNLLKNKDVKLISPFKKGCIKKVVKPLKEYLDNIDDTKM